MSCSHRPFFFLTSFRLLRRTKKRLNKKQLFYYEFQVRSTYLELLRIQLVFIFHDLCKLKSTETVFAILTFLTLPPLLRSFIRCATSPITELTDESSGVKTTPVVPQIASALCSPSKEPSSIPQISAWTCL